MLEKNSWLDDLARQDWVVLSDALPREVCEALAIELLQNYAAGVFLPARISKDLLRQERIRNDSIFWLEQSNEAGIAYFDFMRELKQNLNEYFLLPLNAYEAHFACYEPGGFYQKHRDRFQGDSARQISTVLFLNEDWLAAEAGELVIYEKGPKGRIALSIVPEIGKLVLFMSEHTVHEVLPTRRQRLSLTGWFKILSTQDAVLQGTLF